MYEQAVISGIISQISGVTATVIPMSDYTDERDEDMIIVGVDETLQMHPGLDDYKLNVAIIIDYRITTDLSAAEFFKAKTAVDQALRSIENLFPNFSSVFGMTPVVGFYSDKGDAFSKTNYSNTVIKYVNVILSY